jgi:streptogramin lyase
METGVTRLRWLGCVVSVSVFVCGCGAAGAATGAQVTNQDAATTLTKASPQFVYAIPSGDQMPSALAGDPVRGGAWFLTGSSVSTSIVYVSVDPTQDRSYTLPAVLVFGFDTAIAVDPDGSVWVGARMSLVHLIPATGVATVYPVPTPADSPAAESYLPPSAQGTYDITSLAVSRSGVVAMAISAAAQVTVLSQGQFDAWPLPAGTDPVDVAFLNDGTLGVNLDDYATHRIDEVATFTSNGGRTDSGVIATEVPSLVSTGDAFVSAGTYMATIGDQAQVLRTANLAASGNPEASPIVSLPMSVLPSGNLVLPSMDGISLINSSSGQVTDVALSGGLCGSPTANMPAPPANFSLRPTPAGCPEIPLFVAADRDGNLWLIEPDQEQIAVVQGITF